MNGHEEKERRQQSGERQGHSSFFFFPPKTPEENAQCDIGKQGTGDRQDARNHSPVRLTEVESGSKEYNADKGFVRMDAAMSDTDGIINQGEISLDNWSALTPEEQVSAFQKMSRAESDDFFLGL